MKKNVGLLIPSMNSGGAERVVSILSSILREDYNIYVILFEDTYKEYKCEGTIIDLGIKSVQNNTLNKKLLPLKRAIKLKKIKKEYELQVVISFLDSPNVVNILSKVKNCKTIISVRNYDFDTKKRLVIEAIKYLYKKADCVVSVSKIISEKIIKEYDLNRHKVITIYNPYNIELISKFKIEKIYEDHEKFFEDGFIFISVGRHTYQKGYWHLIKSFNMVHEKYSNSKLIIIGRIDGNEKAEKLVHDLGLERNVLIIGFSENPFKYISKSNAYILSSLFEGFPNAMVEAMACSCPVIAADCKSGPKEILYENPDLSATINSVEMADYGLLVPPLETTEDWNHENYTVNEKILSSAMVMLMENESLLKYYSDKSIKRSEFFSCEKCKQSFKKLID